MAVASASPSPQLCIGAVLFDETHSRVFAIRGLAIEDAREITVLGKAASRGSRRMRMERLADVAEWLRCRAGYTAQLLEALHEARHFDAILVAGPRRPIKLLHDCWPADLSACPTATLKVTVTAGESAILAAAIAQTPALARRRARAATRQEPSRPVSYPKPLPGMALPHPAFVAGMRSARAAQMDMASV